MNTLSSAFLHGLKACTGQWRIAVIVYCLQFCLALTVGMQVYNVLEASIGHSLEINKLLEHYDHTVITDFLKVHGASITPLIGQLRWLLLVWLFFSIFTNAGLMYCVALPQRASWKSFWQGGATFFFSFLKIGLFFLTLALVWTVMILLPTAINIQPSVQYLPSEKYTVWLAFLLLAIWLIGLAVLFLWSVLSRFQRLHNVSIMDSLKGGWQIFRKNKMHFMALLGMFGGLQLMLMAVYFLFEAFVGMTSPALILVVFVVQQLFVFFRIQIRQMMYAGIGWAVKH